jgi:CheY-like chemotaxis protein
LRHASRDPGENLRAVLHHQGVGPGTGLGLAVVHGIVHQSGGHIDVYSEAGTGTTFKIYLPSVREPADVKRPRAGLSSAQRGTETILLAEDDEAVRALTSRVLGQFGYKIMEASDGTHGLQLAKEYMKPIHLLVTDVVMPGMGGKQIAEQLVQMHPEAKVLSISPGIRTMRLFGTASFTKT